MWKLLLIAIGGALIVFVWHALSWLILPFHSNSLNNLPEASFNLDTMVTQMPEAGVYHYPGLPEQDTPEAWETVLTKSRQGPVISLLVYQPSGSDPFSPNQFISGFLINVIASFIVVLLLSSTRIQVYYQRVLFVALLGVFAGTTSYLVDGIWYGYPLAYTLTMIGDVIIGWLLAGLFFAKVIKPDQVYAKE